METCRHGRMRQITECQDCELNEAEAEILVLRAELEQTRDTVLDLFCQACTVKDESGATKYDHICRGTYEYVQEDLITWGLLKADDCVRK